MIAFGREMRDSKNWYGRLPVILIDVHEELSKYLDDPLAYWKRPGVWQDVQSVYRPYLNAWPDDAYMRSIYTRYTCQCGQWAEAKRQIGILGDRAVASALGGAGQM